MDINIFLQHSKLYTRKDFIYLKEKKHIHFS